MIIDSGRVNSRSVKSCKIIEADTVCNKRGSRNKYQLFSGVSCIKLLYNLCKQLSYYYYYYWKITTFNGKLLNNRLSSCGDDKVEPLYIRCTLILSLIYLIFGIGLYHFCRISCCQDLSAYSDFMIKVQVCDKSSHLNILSHDYCCMNYCCQIDHSINQIQFELCVKIES